MLYFFQRGISEEKDLTQINKLDRETYSNKYLLTIQDYKNRLDKNPDHLYIVKNKKLDVIGYVSIIPLTKEVYIKIKNGEVDKEVITADSILSSKDDAKYFYLDSIIVNKNYRNKDLGNKLMHYALSEINKEFKNAEKLVAHAISNGGKKLLKRFSIESVKKVDGVDIVEKTFKNNKA